MIGASPFRCDQKANEIDRRAVEGMEIDRPGKPCKNPENRVCLGELAVRNGNPLANACRSKPFTLKQLVAAVKETMES